VQEHAVVERHRLSLLEREAAVLCGVAVEVVVAEGIRREETVVADVPVGRVPKARRAIENRDADVLPGHFAGVVDPFRGLAPSFFHAVLARGVHDHAAAAFFHAFGEADAEAPLFRVTEDDVSVGRREHDVEIDEALAALEREECECPEIVEDFFAFRSDPLVARLDLAENGAALGCHDFRLADAARLRAFGPEVDAGHAAVGEPERPVVGVVLILALDFRMHGELARHADSTGSDDGEEIRPRRVALRHEAREELSLDVDVEVFAVGFDLDAPVARRPRGDEVHFPRRLGVFLELSRDPHDRGAVRRARRDLARHLFAARDTTEPDAARLGEASELEFEHGRR
jgi:hypothetical protein